jgi:hypothetical protein
MDISIDSIVKSIYEIHDRIYIDQCDITDSYDEEMKIVVYSNEEKIVVYSNEEKVVMYEELLEKIHDMVMALARGIRAGKLPPSEWDTVEPLDEVTS